MTHLAHLGELESAGLVRLAQAEPELEYLFRHALVQEAAYDSLIKRDRRMLHRSIGEALEGLYPQRLDELAPMLGMHFAEAGDDAQALRYLAAAADAAARRYAHMEAIGFLTRALEIAKQSLLPLPPPPKTVEGGGVREGLLTHLFSTLGRELELSARHAEAVQVYVEMEAAARERGDRAMELEALVRRSTVLVTPSSALDTELGEALCQRALALARQLGDRTAEARILWNLMLLHEEYGQVDRAVEYGEQSLALARELNLRQQAAFTLNDISGAYMFVGQTQRALEALEEARAFWHETGNQPMLADNLGRTSLLHFVSGRFHESLQFGEEAHRVSRATQNLWGESFALMGMGWARMALGEVGEAIRALEESVRLGEQGGFAFPLVSSRVYLAFMLRELGASARGLEITRLTLAKAEAIHPSERATLLATQAYLHIHLGDPEAAERALRQGQDLLDFNLSASFGVDLLQLADAELALARGDSAHALTVTDRYLAAARQATMSVFRVRALHLKARALLQQTRLDEAAVILSEARALAEAREARFDWLSVLATLSQLEATRGRPAEAEGTRAQAREIAGFIAAHCPPDLRETFLNTETVKSVRHAA